MSKNNMLYDGFHKIENIKTTIKGKEVTREKLHLPSGVAGLVVDSDKRIAIVNQFRPTINKYTKEIPAGVLDKGLTPIETLLEELYEECLLTQSEVITIDTEPFYKYHMVTGSSDATTELYYVTVITQPYKEFEIKDDNDVESVEWVTLEELESYVKEGLIVDSKTLLAYEYAKGIIG